jgi:SAM-dependent methyltransferase
MATDISGVMVEVASQRVRHEGYDYVQVARMDAENLEVDDCTYDVAVCALGLMYVPEPEVALAEMRRVVKTDGRVVATVWGERRNCGWASIFPVVDAVVNSEVCPLFFGLGVPGALARLMGSVGLNPTEEVRRHVDLCWPDAKALLAAVIDGGAVALAARRFSPDTRSEVEKTFLASVSEYRNSDGSYVIPGEFVTVAGSVS